MPHSINLTKKIDWVLQVTCCVLLTVSIWGWLNYPANVDTNFGKLFYVMIMSPIVALIQLYALFHFVRDPKRVLIDFKHEKLLFEGRGGIEFAALSRVELKKNGYRFKIKVYFRNSSEKSISTGNSYIIAEPVDCIRQLFKDYEGIDFSITPNL